MHISDITDGELPRALSGLGQTKSGGVFTDGGTTVLQRGSRGEQVRRMQVLLNTFGYKLQTDGIFGPGTETAVGLVQVKLGLARTGIYDKALDDRITGMNQSGIIDALPADKQAVLTAATPKPSTQTVPGLVVSSGTPKPSDTALMQGGGVMTPAPSSLMEKLHNFVQPLATKLKVDPHYVVVGGTVVVGAVALYGAWVVMQSMKTTTPASPVQTVALPGVNGLGRMRKHRKSRRKSRSKKSKK